VCECLSNMMKMCHYFEGNEDVVFGCVYMHLSLINDGHCASIEALCKNEEAMIEAKLRSL